MQFKREARKLVNRALSMVDLEIVQRQEGLRRWFGTGQTPSLQALTHRPPPEASHAGTAQVPFGMVVPSLYGPIIVNRHDINQTNALIKTGAAFNHSEIQTLCEFLKNGPDNPVVLDVGANLGLYALAFARAIASRRGVCHAFEAQRVFAGMIGGTAALNGVLNLHVHHAAIGDVATRIRIPGFDYNRELNFGSIEFGDEQREVLSQDRADGDAPELVEQRTIDSFEFSNVTFIKIDIEGMEENALRGAMNTVASQRPVLCIEWIKSRKQDLLEFGRRFDYQIYEWGSDLLFVPPSREDARVLTQSFTRVA